MLIPITIKSLELEMTRRCNQNCVHCLRGCSQNFDMTPEILKNIFTNGDYQITKIYELFVTGGEPFLNREA